ncbi:MAG TPA: DUF1800 domain-containing protein [Kiloniellales bacterium]|nr:DUF1800 domain-containing protein [Kiloniellales bacterium]
MVDFATLCSLRLGYGLSPRLRALSDPDALLATLSGSEKPAPAVGMEQAREVHLQIAELNPRVREGKAGAEKERKEVVRRARKLADRETLRRFARAVEDPGGFGERLVQFWSDHFTVSAGNAYQQLMAVAFVEEAIRPHIRSSFADLLFAAETHPRMITYLDQQNSVGPNSVYAKKRRERRKFGLNENFAREMIELHSLGVGADYSQRDVRELAELLTGLSYSPGSDGLFRRNRAEPGPETVLGRTYGDEGPAKLDDIRAVIRDLACHPATARHLARKLAVHFVADEPPPALVDRLAAVYEETEGDLAALYAELVRAPELLTHFHAKVRQPFDLLVAALRGLGVTGEELMALERKQQRAWLTTPMARMGQNWGRPPGPDGWPEAAEAWITAQGMAARIDWALRVPSRLCQELPDPRGLLEAALGETASAALRWAVPRAESRPEGVALVLASTDFNRR